MAHPPVLRAAVAAVGLALLLGACGAATSLQDRGASSPSTSAGFGPDGPGPSERPDPALSGQPVPTLPPGDPGTESGPPDEDGDDGDHPGEDGDHDEPLTSIPESALVDQETVAALAGGHWSVDPVEAEACATAEVAGSTASRLLTLTAAEGHLVQRVSAHPGVGAAKAAVPATADRLTACGFTSTGDPRLGRASAKLTRPSPSGGEDVALVIAAEGVSVVLVATGSAATPGVWESLADVALGTSCAAGAHGCH
jgi:hypothetical protein